MSWLALVAALFCVAANAFFVAAEFALVKVRPTQLQQQAAEGDPTARRALQATKQLDAYLGATQLGITLASLGLGWLGEPALASTLEVPVRALGLPATAVHPIALSLAFAVITLLHIVVGELAPKSVAIQRPVWTAKATARLMHAFYWAAYPFLFVLNGTANLLLRAAGLESADHAHGAVSPQEIRLIVQSSFRAGSLEGPQRDLLERVLAGSGRTVRAVMVPRVDMTVLSLGDGIEACIERVRSEGFSRFPLCEDNDRDRIVGYVYAKDLLTAQRSIRGGLGALRRDVLFVPESRNVAEVLEDFRRTNTPIAIVVDEYGGTSGLVTLEDCVEEIVGDIQDETDHEERPHTQILPDGTVVVDGALPFGDLEIEELRDLAEDGDETVGSYVMEQLGRLPRPGDRVRLGEFEVTVEVITRRRIERVAFRALPESQPPEET